MRSRIWDKFWSKFLNNLKQMFKEQIKENSFSSKRQHDMSQCADNEINVAERQALCAIFMALSKAKQWNPRLTWMSRQFVLTHAWIIKNWNRIISKTRDKGLLLDYCTSGAGLPFYAIASSDSSRFNRGLYHITHHLLHTILITEQ